MLGRSSAPVVIDRYASRRRRRAALPGWLWLLLLGAAIGAAAVVYVQQAHLPPRLSAAESSRLQSAATAADTERSRLAAELAQARALLGDNQTARQRAAGELTTAQREPDALRAQIEALLDALPVDPRGGTVQVRAVRFEPAAGGGPLGYHLVLSRAAAAGAAPLPGVLQFTIAGTPARGGKTTLTLTPEPVPVSVARLHIASGNLALPAGFVPRRATIRILDRPGGKLLGMRVINVR